MFEALAESIAAVKNNESKLAFFVSLRARELLDSRKKSFVDMTSVRADSATPYVDEPRMRSEFVRLRHEADEWSRERTEFMMARLKKGRHPDTDLHFWDGYVSRPAPHIQYALLDTFNEDDRLMLELGTCCASPFVLMFAFWRIGKKRRMNRDKAA
jgi:hypothetical protein